MAAGALALGGCSDDGAGEGAATATAPPGAAPAAGAMLADGGLSVAEARDAEGRGTIAVRAHLFVAPDGSARLCDVVGSRSPRSAAGPPSR